MRRFVAEALQDDFTVSVAADGWSGVDRACEPNLDLVVVGSPVARLGKDHIVTRIRACRHLARVPILIRSADAEHALRVRLLREGALDYVVEPFSVQELRARALNLANVKRLRDVLEAHATDPSQDLHALARELASARRQAEQAQRKAEAESRAKDEFLAMVAHDVRTPLNAIVGWASLLNREDVATSTRRRAADGIHRNAGAAAHLVTDLLDASAMAQGQVRLRLEIVALRRVLAEALDAVRPVAEAKGVALHWRCEDGELAVVGDADRLRQVLHNLLANAITFTLEGGHVMARVGGADGAVVIEVEDTGVGIDRDVLPRIFDRFARGEAGTRRSRGLGLGLTIVRHLVELHGGSVEVASPGEGQGTCFTVRLPARRDHERGRVDATVDGSEVVPRAPLVGLRVLLVEADPHSRQRIVSGLQPHGAIVLPVATVSEAAHLLDDFGADLLLSDADLPEEDGYAIIELLQSRARRIPAIALTTYRLDEQPSPLSAGYWHQVGKPVDIGELVTMISAVTRVGRRHDE